MKITHRQKAILDSFTCERLTSDADNWALIRKFTNGRNPGLARDLRRYGWQEDSEGETAFYLIKNEHNEPLLYFSVKCGSLFDMLAEKQDVLDRLDTLNQAMQALSRGSADEDDYELIRQAAYLLREGDAQAIEDFMSISSWNKWEEMRETVDDKTGKLKKLHRESKEEPNSRIIHVGRTFPGVELVQFCANDSAKMTWRRYDFGQPMGKVLFWWFVAPLAFELQKLVGCKYMYLFAADLSETQSLVNYYRSLSFGQPPEIATNKPAYDLICQFMCQEVNAMKAEQKRFFDHFNPDSFDELV